MMRLFTGLAFPWQVREELRRMAGGLPGARWIEPENLHITLSFLGDVREARLEDLDEVLWEVRGAVFNLGLGGLGEFSVGHRPNTLWVGVEKAPALMQLQARCDRALARAGFHIEKRKYLPHVTLARLDSASPVELARYIVGHNLVRCGPFRVDRFILYSSHAGKGGSSYRIEAEYAFT